MSGSTLSPWDFSGLGMGFGLYRPRRPSYTYATQQRRQRSESYRYATHREAESVDAAPQEDYIDNVLSKMHSDGHGKAAAREPHHENCLEMNHLSDKHLPRGGESSGHDALCESQNHINQKFAAQQGQRSSVGHPDSLETNEMAVTEFRVAVPGSEQGSSVPSVAVCGFKKNLIVLCISFILIFSSFRGVQNLQSSLNAQDQLGIISMSCLHGTMVLTCLLAPFWTNIFTAKWTLVLGSLCFLLWFGANFYPAFYTLLPASMVAGFGHGLLWTAETSYLIKLAFDSARLTKDHLDQEMFRFHAVFLACFQTTHIWGNLISSFLLGQRSQAIQEKLLLSFQLLTPTSQRILFQHQYHSVGCFINVALNITFQYFLGRQYDRADLWPVLWKLMCAYLLLAFLGFCLVLLLLDHIGARADPDSSGLQMMKQHVLQLVQHRTYRLLIPLLIFSGLQQGFMYTDYNLYYVTCSLGVDYIGYCMITLGASNVVGAMVVALVSHRLPREVVLGFGVIMHIALMIGFLIWIPDKRPMLFFVLAAAWGVCDSVWQTQCNTLLCLTCTEAPEVAFANSRMLQSLGLTLAFSMGTYMCVAGKLYLLMTVLVLSIMFYVLAEYRLRHNDDDVFEDP
ncbi:protein unc-93 homolog A-like isoform X2 [Pomacea canaliculata]|nr:protein unc-93 homolog A-like isoform X2 [Pomacea canaliculata]